MSVERIINVISVVFVVGLSFATIFYLGYRIVH